MKKTLFVVIIALFCISKLEARKVEGKIIFENDTLEVIFDIPIRLLTQEPQYRKLQQKVRYYNAEGKKKVIKPDHAKEIQFEFEGKTIRMLSVYNNYGLGSMFTTSDNIFLKLEVDGRLKLFKHYYLESSQGAYNPSTNMSTGSLIYTKQEYLFYKDGKLRKPPFFSFRKNMAKFFSDCPALAEKINNKELRSGNLEAIVRFYNSNCEN